MSAVNNYSKIITGNFIYFIILFSFVIHNLFYLFLRNINLQFYFLNFEKNFFF